MANSKEPIKLRMRKMATGNTSLYLDIYLNGRREYEYLHLYLIPEKGKRERDLNRETMRLAEAIRAKRVVDFQNGRFGFESGKKAATDFLEYFRKMCKEKREKSENTYGTWDGVRQLLEEYCKPGTTFKDIDARWLAGFKRFLGSAESQRGLPLSQNSKVTYFQKVRACVNRAVREGILQKNPLLNVPNFKTEEKERTYLTLEEVRALAATPCKNPALKRAFLFSCLTGLRISDITRLLWGDVRSEDTFTRIVFRQKKTGGQEYIDISPEAVPYLGERCADDVPVFLGMGETSKISRRLRKWAVQCGIRKPITFHSARHTFAVLMLNLGADIYTVQKLLGHRSLETTQVYAHIVDKKKQNAVLLIPKI